MCECKCDPDMPSRHCECHTKHVEPLCSACGEPADFEDLFCPACILTMSEGWRRLEDGSELNLTEHRNRLLLKTMQPKCPTCGGPADQGSDPRDPHNPYPCLRCDIADEVASRALSPIIWKYNAVRAAVRGLLDTKGSKLNLLWKLATAESDELTIAYGNRTHPAPIGQGSSDEE